MCRHALNLLLLLCSLLLVSCGLPSNPPATVTDPTIRDIYAKALQGDGNALYQVSQMYGNGSHGFPQSSWYASIALNDAAGHNQPEAVYDSAVSGLGRLRSRLTAQHASEDTYKDWAKLEDDLLALRREVDRAGTLGDARAAATIAAIDADLARYRQLSVRERAHYVKCPLCLGEGSKREWIEAYEKQGRHDKVKGGHFENVACRRCHGRGFIVR